MSKRKELEKYISLKHELQVRKYTNEPYFNHLVNVANMVDEYGDFLYEVGLCHDLLEDTDTSYSQFLTMLLNIGYSAKESSFIFNKVVELTDIYTHEDYPNLNRKARKELEAIRLYGVSYEAQTIKYADLIDNTSSIVEYDPGFAVKYLKEKEFILSGMSNGNEYLYGMAMLSLNDAKNRLL
jgi:(p)ppGpp synthase/HD superfamily hydrolase